MTAFNKELLNLACFLVSMLATIALGLRYGLQ
jgi:hypothetical protein